MGRNAKFRFLGPILAVFFLVSVNFVYWASQANVVALSPQGCRMSWMSPSYILQSDFDEIWTPLSRRYSLWLYREVEWDVATKACNAGSSRQVRSIASSAARQYYTSPGVLNPAFTSRRPLDFYAVEFNEDLSALHGPTIETQTEYVSSAISYILSSYHGPRRQILIIGHSMGGIVARLLLTTYSHHGWNTSDVEALITMSTPHSLPPARFDASIEKVYSEISHWEGSDAYVQVPTVSICGGSTDDLIPSETCVLPPLTGRARQKYDEGPWYRGTVHTTALSGIWTGVGHKEMVWCHQVRWRVARAALELDHVKSIELVRALPLDLKGRAHTIVTTPTLRVSSPTSHTYLLRAPSHKQTLTVMVGKGTLTNPAMSPTILSHLSSALRVSLYPLPPNLSATAHVLPFVRPNTIFPLKEGADETDWVLYWSGDVGDGSVGQWIGVVVETAAAEFSDAFVLAGFDQERTLAIPVNTYGLSLRTKHIHLDQLPFSPFKTRISLPNLNSNSLLVYSLDAVYRGNCDGRSFMNPLIGYTVPSENARESQFYTPSSRRILLSGHSLGPFIRRSAIDRGALLEIYTSGACGLEEVNVKLDWKASGGRIGLRYWSSVPIWVMGVVYLSSGITWSAWDLGYLDLLDPIEALEQFTVTVLLKIIPGLFLLSLLPLPSQFLLGNSGDPLFAFLAPAFIIVATGATWALFGTIYSIVRLLTAIRRRLGYLGAQSTSRSTTLKVFAWLFLFLLAKFVVPTQAIYFLAYARHMWRCSRPQVVRSSFTKLRISPPPSSDNILFIVECSSENHKRRDGLISDIGISGRPTSPTLLQAQQLHILVLFSALFPFVGTTIIVWVQTLATAGFFLPFRGDHDLWRVFAFICVAECSDEEIRKGKSPPHLRVCISPGFTTLLWSHVQGVASKLVFKKLPEYPISSPHPSHESTESPSQEVQQQEMIVPHLMPVAVDE
ncbi:PGAP1-like protein-domain-containing protein [Cantharellus anzutake]|uniref:PGAP1-like protein-domain-containing protein n=1 Tax=Cantharellus anzutake TaxID=1750568 RepID=UPI0019060731|nr:PGAP1-like protein-domain-containing protein [Cantharellus anzutake]KAF8325172.1 PGAP1-like protein-domain-containing protein [Cantharellus anzutake]